MDKIVIDFPPEEMSIEEFRDEVCHLSQSYGKGSQDGIKYALTLAQDNFGFVDNSTQEIIGECFGVDAKAVKALIKFMPNIKEEVIACEIVCCSGPRCAKNGSVEVLKAVKETLGMKFDEISKDGQIKLTTQNCFKHCGHGPNIRVNGNFHHHMNREKTIELMKSLLEKYSSK